jgi:hypothetical protein
MKRTHNGNAGPVPHGSTPKRMISDIGSLHWKLSREFHFVQYDGVSKSFRTGHLQWELQMIQLSATSCSCVAILWVSLVNFAAITFFVASQRTIIVVSVYFVIDSVWKLLDRPSYNSYNTWDYNELS